MINSLTLAATRLVISPAVLYLETTSPLAMVKSGVVVGVAAKS